MSCRYMIADSLHFLHEVFQEIHIAVLQEEVCCQRDRYSLVAVSKVMDKDEFIKEMRSSYEHKFAKKPEVIEGNMQALIQTFDALKDDLKDAKSLIA